MPRYSIRVEAEYGSYRITTEREVRKDSAIEVVSNAVYDLLDDMPSGSKITSITLKRLRPIGD